MIKLGVDQNAITSNLRVLGSDEANSSQVVDLVDPSAHGKKSMIEVAQIQNLELVGVWGFALRSLEVNTANPVPFSPEPLHQMMTHESPSPGHENAAIFRHRFYPFDRIYY